jgi:hypothetical protein
LDLKQIVEAKLKAAISKIQDNLESTGTNASGRTSQSLRLESSDYGFIIYGRKAFATVETGRMSGGIPKGFNDIIKQWIKDKGISVTQIPYKRKESENWRPKYSVSERSLNIAAGAISFTIKKSGTSLFRKGGRKDIFSNAFSEALPEIKKDIQFEIIKQIKLNL